MADFDWLTGGVGDYLSSTTSQVQTPKVATSPMSTSFFQGANDFISSSLNLWQQYETIQKYKDSTAVGQKEVINTIQTPNPNSDQTYVNPAQQMQQQFAGALKMGAGTYIGIGAAVLVAWYLLKK